MASGNIDEIPRHIYPTPVCLLLGILKKQNQEVGERLVMGTRKRGAHDDSLVDEKAEEILGKSLL